MAKSVSGRRVRMFRCQIPPLIGPKILNAHVPADMGWEAEINAEGTGIVVKTKEGKEYFVFGANIQNSELYPEEVVVEPVKRLRQVKSEAV